MNNWRRFVYVVVNNFNHGTYPLRRIDASSLFLATNQMAGTLEEIKDAPLPRPFLAFTPAREIGNQGNMEFFSLFGRGERKSLIAAVDYKEFSFTYDLEECSLHNIACPNQRKQSNPISLGVGDALYVMDKKQVPGSRCAFEALTYDPPKNVLGKPDWYWHCLQQPPYVLEPGYKPTCIHAYTVVGGSKIWISTAGIGTYSFDTASGLWSRAGNWLLPFNGGANYIPDYDLWLGFSWQDNKLCSLHLKDTPTQDGPTLDNVWDDLHAPEHWILRKSCLVHLGFDKFCVAKFFETVYNEPTERGFIPQTERFVVLTGLLLKPSASGRGLDMVPQRSTLQV